MNKIDPEHCAFAAQSYNPNLEKTFQQKGLTKREYFAAMALQGLMSVENKGTGDWTDLVKTAARISVQASDAIINELNKQP